MADWYITTESVQVVKDSTGLLPQIITAVSSIVAALGGVCLTHRFTRKREERTAADKAAAERLYIATELVFLLERYAIAWMSLQSLGVNELSDMNKIPSIDFSPVKGDWRTLPSPLLFKIRSIETNQAVLSSRLKDGIKDYFLLKRDPLTHDCLKTGIRAFILAAKLRRVAGLPDSVHLKSEKGILDTLRYLRKSYWHRIVLEKSRWK